MINFGLYRAEAHADLNNIADADLETALVVSGTRNGVNTSFTLSSAPSFAQVLKNGQILTRGTDYTISGVTITFAVPPKASDILLVLDYQGYFIVGGGGGSGITGDIAITSGSGQTVFNPGFAITDPLVFLNGIRQNQGVDYVVSAGTVIFNGALNLGDIVQITAIGT